MPDKLVSKSQQFDCPKCNRTVVFRYIERQFFAAELVEPIGKSIDKLTSYGQCEVAASAKIPNHPIHSEMVECPIYKKFHP